MYGKIFDSMYDGTLYGQWEAIVTFQQLIVLCDADGTVDMTPPAIAARTSIPLEIITKGLEILSKPDPYSRTPGSEGRRIELIDDHRPWGWTLVNHSKYKMLIDAETVREQNRERQRKHRESTAAVTSNAPSRSVTPSNASNAPSRHTDTDTDTDTKTLKPKAPRRPVGKEKVVELPDWLPLEQWQAYLEMRQRIRKPATPYAQNMAIAKLSELREQGQHPAAVLGQAIMNSWQGIFPLKEHVRAA